MKKVINRGTTREKKLYGKDIERINNYYKKNFNKSDKTLKIDLNILGYTELENKENE